MSTATLSRTRRAGVQVPKHPRDYVRIGLWIALVIVMVIWAMPMVFVFLTSLKSVRHFLHLILLHPQRPGMG